MNIAQNICGTLRKCNIVNRLIGTHRMMSSTTINLTDTASLEGIVTFARDSKKSVYAFRGVPYTEPPVGPNRFRTAVPLKLWRGKRDATKFGPACPQEMARVTRTYGNMPNLPAEYSEDCLYLNVYTPSTDPSAGKLPVMLWLHGGAFVQGFSNIYDGTSLCTFENVVVVSINYRLGVFGSLYTGDGPLDYPGNQGLQDQLEALRWVQKYISCFGGDPNNVTIFGQSAGAISISYHQVSPAAHPTLFHRSICQSGSAIYPNCVWTKPGGQKYFHKRLSQMGFTGKKSEDLVQFLESKTTDQLMQTFNDWFVPTIVDGKYLPIQPLDAYNKGSIHPVDCLIGFNSSEGTGFVPPLVKNREKAVEIISSLVAKNFFRGSHPAIIEEVSKASVALYLSPASQEFNYTEAVSDFHGDVNFVAPGLKQAELHSKHARTYVYLFDHRPCFSGHPEWVRADHSNEVAFVFGYPFLQDIPDIWPEEEKTLSKFLMKYWANFARTGNPNGDDGLIWNQFTQDQPLYITLRTPEQSSVAKTTDLLPDRMLLWNKTVPEIINRYTTNKSKY